MCNIQQYSTSGTNQQKEIKNVYVWYAKRNNVVYPTKIFLKNGYTGIIFFNKGQC